jgi:hypothetical protein
MLKFVNQFFVDNLKRSKSLSELLNKKTEFYTDRAIINTDIQTPKIQLFCSREEKPNRSFI